ncbi:MAG: FadR family transcriptional regulator [Chloroflexi bacterium]|nr:FadR family transcriptional regulator [Chloroflexota bacterium]
MNAPTPDCLCPSVLTRPTPPCYYAARTVRPFGNRPIFEGADNIVFTPVKQTRIVEEICRQVTDRIVGGQLRPGDRLPSERDLAATFEVGRSTVRESLRKLEHAGLIIIRTGSAGGAYIVNSGPEPVTRALALMLQLEQVSPEDLLEARKAIEGTMVRLAALRASTGDLEKIKAALDSPDNFSSKEGFVGANADYHESIADAAKSKVLSSTLLAVRELIGLSIRVLPIDRAMMVQSHSYHTKIYEAIAVRDADTAQREMEEHLEQFERKLLPLLSKGRDPESF